MKILGFGDNIIDRFVDRGLAYPGGNCVNVAVFARMLRAESSYLGVFGSDRYGELMRAALTAEGVGYNGSVVRDGPSGVTELTVVDGERVFGDWNGGGVTVTDPLVLDAELVAYVSGFDLVHSSVYSASESELFKLRAGTALVSYDLSSESKYRTPEYLDRVCPAVDLALISGSNLSDEEARVLLHDIVGRGAGLALATRGTQGAMVYDGHAFVEVPAKIIADPSLIVDTMGCGDAFLAAFAVSLLGSRWHRSFTPGPEALKVALTSGAAFAADQCFIDGAFGHARDERDLASETRADVGAQRDASPSEVAHLDTM
ncbi:MAG: PfkB family carbohydrate kinase [Rhodoglobus sp.]